MSEGSVKPYTDFVLPACVVSKLDVSRLVSEVERVDGELTTASIRSEVDSSEVAQPILSEQLLAFLHDNELTLEGSHERTELVRQLQLLKNAVPTIHMTFAAQADRETLQRLTQWLRESIHSQVVLTVGLQPGLVAGAAVRTQNRVYDFSLRKLFADSHTNLVKKLETLREAN